MKTSPLALQRLYVDVRNKTESPEEDIPTIKALGKVWQALFRESQRTQFGSLLELLGNLESGEVATSKELRSRLQLISTELQGEPNESEDLTVALQKNSSPTILQLDELEQSTY